jgi:HEAT repeat protein
LSGHEAGAYAASALGELGPQARSAEPQLRAALKHKEAGVRVNAAAALGRVGATSPDTITALIGLLKNDPEREVRRATAGALGAIGPAAREAIPVLAEAMAGDGKGGWWVAADALARIGGPDAVPPLIEGLKNADEDVRLTAIRGLGKLGAVAQPAVEALEKASQNDANATNRAAAAEALRKIGR